MAPQVWYNNVRLPRDLIFGFLASLGSYGHRGMYEILCKYFLYQTKLQAAVLSLVAWTMKAKGRTPRRAPMRKHKRGAYVPMRCFFNVVRKQEKGKPVELGLRRTAWWIHFWTRAKKIFFAIDRIWLRESSWSQPTNVPSPVRSRLIERRILNLPFLSAYFNSVWFIRDSR